MGCAASSEQCCWLCCTPLYHTDCHTSVLCLLNCSECYHSVVLCVLSARYDLLGGFCVTCLHLAGAVSASLPDLTSDFAWVLQHAQLLLYPSASSYGMYYSAILTLCLVNPWECFQSVLGSCCFLPHLIIDISLGF
jgi:hypothetical protein